MEVALIILLFISTALSLNFLVNNSIKLSGAFDIVNLCLIVAVAYQFKQIKNVIWVLIAAVLIVVAFFLVKFYLTKKKSHNVIDATVIEHKGDKDE